MIQLANAAGYEGEDQGCAEAWVLDQIEAGQSAYSVYRQVGEVGDWKPATAERMFYFWLNDRRFNPDGRDADTGRRGRYREAQRVGALARSDGSEAVLERLVDDEGRRLPGVESVDVQLARERGRTRERLAAQHDPANYGERQAGGDGELGELMLEALKAGMKKRLAAGQGPALLDAEVLEAEVVE
jgi:hypothetical protein